MDVCAGAGASQAAACEGKRSLSLLAACVVSYIDRLLFLEWHRVPGFCRSQAELLEPPPCETLQEASSKTPEPLESCSLPPHRGWDVEGALLRAPAAEALSEES